ncbi:hypothetical protein [Patulibacter sp.]|uniref:hypothetical protein n=1 Tax=Patulibacter sp. TaxID=1912859 RepID=UPI002725A41D|nr:hypothetical protein [Patulibacter sp.]MDO9409719.1 hypothetical protein [Patulibacter sp.]
MTVSPPASRPFSTDGPSRARVRRAVPVAALAAAAILAGCGADDGTTTNAAATTAGAPPRPALADDVPARSAAFAEATVRPGGDTKTAVDQLLALVGTGGKSGKGSHAGLSDGFLPKGVSLREDVLPHVGDHVGAFLLGGTPSATSDPKKAADGAIVAEVRDADALRKAVGSAGTEEQVGAETIRVRDGHAVWIGEKTAAFGSEKAVRAAIASAAGDDLSGNARFTGALDQVRTTSPVGVAWVDLQQAPALNGAFTSLAAHLAEGRSASKARSSALGSLPKSLRDRVEQRLGSKGTSARSVKAAGFGLKIPARDATAAMALELTPGRLVVRSGGTGSAQVADPKVGSDAVAALPSGSWAAFGGGTSGSFAKGSPGAKAFDLLSGVLGSKTSNGLRDALAGVEAVSGGAQGQNLLAASGGVLLRAKDDDAAKALMTQLQGALSGKGGPLAGKLGGTGGLTAKPQSIDGADSGFVLGLPGLPLQLAAGVQGDRVAIGLGPDSVTKALKPAKPFSDDALYAQAKEELGGVAPSFVLQPKPLTDLLSSLGDGLGGLLGNMGGLGGGSGSAKGASGIGGLLSSDGFGRAVDAAGRVKLVTAAREKTGATTWRGSLVVRYDAAKAPAKP